MNKSADSSVSISLVIPSYNRGKLIAETIHSALAQTAPFAEIIVVEDGSSDNTDQVLLSFGDRIRVIRLAHGGVQRARNAGVAASSGQYCTFCDSDDLLDPRFVETAVAGLEQYPDTDAFYCNFVTFDQSGSHADKFSLAPPAFFDGAATTGQFIAKVPDLYARTIDYQALFMSGCLVRKAFFQSLGGFNTAFNGVGGEDWEFTLRAVAAGKVLLCSTVLAKIRKHSGNASADALRQVLGTARILEYALTAHAAAAKYHNLICASIDHRRRMVFQEAFARGKFELAFEMLSLLSNTHADLKFRLKVFIMRMPRPLRHGAWRLTQLQSLRQG